MNHQLFRSPLAFYSVVTPLGDFKESDVVGIRLINEIVAFIPSRTPIDMMLWLIIIVFLVFFDQVQWRPYYKDSEAELVPALHLRLAATASDGRIYAAGASLRHTTSGGKQP